MTEFTASIACVGANAPSLAFSAVLTSGEVYSDLPTGSDLASLPMRRLPTVDCVYGI